MAGFCCGCHADICQTFFGDADHCKWIADAHRHFLQNGAAFIQYKPRLDALLCKPLHHLRRGVTGSLFAVAGTEVDVTFRCEALAQQSVHSFKHSRKDAFGVHSAAGVDRSIVDLRSKRRIVPVLSLHRHYIVMSHEDDRLQRGILSLPFQHDTVGVDESQFTVLKDAWKLLFQHRKKGIKDCPVCTVILAGNRWHLQNFLKTANCLFLCRHIKTPFGRNILSPV